MLQVGKSLELGISISETPKKENRGIYPENPLEKDISALDSPGNGCLSEKSTKGNFLFSVIGCMHITPANILINLTDLVL